jgi:hypothetical protein
MELYHCSKTTVTQRLFINRLLGDAQRLLNRAMLRILDFEWGRSRRDAGLRKLW